MTEVEWVKAHNRNYELYAPEGLVNRLEFILDEPTNYVGVLLYRDNVCVELHMRDAADCAAICDLANVTPIRHARCFERSCDCTT